LAALDCLALPEEEMLAIPILRSALLAPTKAILRNSGFEPNPIIERMCNGAHSKDHNTGFDVMDGQFVDVMAANIVDPVKVLHAALRTGVSGALMALTTAVLVHKPRANRDEDVDFNP